MARNSSPAESLLKEIVAQAISPPLKVAGFRKTGMNYHRRRGETVQVVNVQVSHGSTPFEKSFYVNVGLAFDAICRLMELPILEKPKEYECDERGTRGRLETLVADCPARWIVTAGEELSEMTRSLHDSIEQLSAELDRIDGIVAYRGHTWFDRFRPMLSNAQVLSLLGDEDEAWCEIQDLVRLFSDRRNAPGPERLIDRLRLSNLKPRLSNAIVK